jgi:malic enzyme
MFAAAADRLAEEVRDEDLAGGMLFPPQSQIRRVSAAIAAAVVRQAREEGLAGRIIPDDKVEETVKAAMWEPLYPHVIPA